MASTRSSTKRTPNQIGDDFEVRVTSTLGGRRVPQSGGGKFYKCDTSDGDSFIYSCKATEETAIRVTTAMFREAERAARGPRGRGDSAKPAIAIEIDGLALVLCRLEDWAAMQTRPPEERPQASSKAEERRARIKASPIQNRG